MLKSNKRRDSGRSSLTVIGAGTRLKCRVSSEDDIRVDGEIEGELVTTGRIVIGKTGYVHGYIKAAFVVIEGKAKGDFIADNEFTIIPGGEMRGTIKTKHVNIKEKAFFDGMCYILDEADPKNDQKFETSGEWTSQQIKSVEDNVVKLNGKDVSSDFLESVYDLSEDSSDDKEKSVMNKKSKLSLLNMKMKQIRSI
ncbi:bactofilin family protein [Maribellus maritimus]|uniref:bactofilin family protein n=1 Tax=Maribellus maritimus TaxID=2870838 RepID=UPI001EEC7ADA|nr:polymer-forming cytoskeletal protein [Maribellus maritimus]MCG6188864.1 polymer-forming cytoskeletal protein [Maribellus maritimus]